MSRQEQYDILPDPWRFHLVSGMLGLASSLQLLHKCSRSFFRDNLVAVFVVMSKLPKLKGLTEAASSAVFDFKHERLWVFRVNVGMGGEHHRGCKASWTDCEVHRGPSEALWTLPGFYNGLYLPRCQRNGHHTLPSLMSHLEAFLRTSVCWFLCFARSCLSEGLLAA